MYSEIKDNVSDLQGGWNRKYSKFEFGYDIYVVIYGTNFYFCNDSFTI